MCIRDSYQEQQLDVAAAQALPSNSLFERERQRQQHARDNERPGKAVCENGKRRTSDQPQHERPQADDAHVDVVEGERRHPYDNARKNESVGNGKGVQIDQRKTQKHTAKRAQGKGVDGQTICPDHACKENGT